MDLDADLQAVEDCFIHLVRLTIEHHRSYGDNMFAEFWHEVMDGPIRAAKEALEKVWREIFWAKGKDFLYIGCAYRTVGHAILSWGECSDPFVLGHPKPLIEALIEELQQTQMARQHRNGCDAWVEQMFQPPPTTAGAAACQDEPDEPVVVATRVDAAAVSRSGPQRRQPQVPDECLHQFSIGDPNEAIVIYGREKTKGLTERRHKVVRTVWDAHPKKMRSKELNDASHIDDARTVIEELRELDEDWFRFLLVEGERSTRRYAVDLPLP